MTRFSFAPFSVVLIFWAVLFGSGCGSSAPVVVEPEEPVVEAEVAGLPLVVFNNVIGRLVVNDLKARVEQTLGATGEAVFSSLSPDGQSVVLAVKGQGLSELHLYNQPQQSAVVLYSGAASTVFSGQWDANSSTFYFGQYVPEGKRMGAGAIYAAAVQTGAVERVPCSASRMVLGVVSESSLLVRNSDSIYEVAIADCATLHTIDARKWYHVSVSPTNNRLAYVLRDLVYNRETRAYEPDSTLYLATLKGTDEVKVIGDKYEPRNVTWSPDGLELAYDVNAQDGSGRRAISVYSVETARSSYLEPPDATPNSNSHPAFSRDGSIVSFRSISPDGQADTMWKSSGEPFSRTVPGDADTPTAFELKWMGAKQAFVRSPSGEASILDLSAGDGVVQWTHPSALFAASIR